MLRAIAITTIAMAWAAASKMITDRINQDAEDVDSGRWIKDTPRDVRVLGDATARGKKNDRRQPEPSSSYTAQRADNRRKPPGSRGRRDDGSSRRSRAARLAARVACASRFVSRLAWA